jgi:hypothetical protein
VPASSIGYARSDVRMRISELETIVVTSSADMEGTPVDRTVGESGATAPLRLYCLGGGAAPPELGADLLRLARLPTEALGKIWQVLGPSLAERIAPETGQLLDVFCAAYRIDADDLAPTLKACRFVIREASRLDAPAGALADDLDRLCPGAPLVREIVLAGYEAAKAQIRHEILKSALADHGKLLVSLNWRVDAIQASERGMRLGLPVSILTLHYREGAETGRVTLQVLPDMLGELRRVCDQILG